MEHQNPRVKALGHQTIMPYLVLKNATGFIEFAKKLFHVEVQYLKNRSENSIMHAELRFYGSTVMVADATEAWSPMPSGIFIYVDDADETYRQAMEYGAEPVQEPSDQSYGRAAGIRDAWGNHWWITSLPAGPLPR